MIDKLDLRIPASASFTPDFRFVGKEVKYAGVCSTVSRSQHYQGVIDLRPFGIDAMLHAYKRRNPKSHKLELFDTGLKTLDQMAQTVTKIFEVDPGPLGNMRVDLTADIFGVRVEQLRRCIQVSFKRSIDERGQMDFANVGGRRIEYFRYGKSPNCVRVYDKPAECRARLPQVLKHCNPDAELPSFLELFGFPENAIFTRIERQCGGNRIPPELAKFRDLQRAAEYNPFQNVKIHPEQFPFPDADEYGVSERMKLIGTAVLVERVGLQQARSELNRDGNGKRHWQVYEEHLRLYAPVRSLDIGQVVDAYRASTQAQVENRIRVDVSAGGTHNVQRHENPQQDTRILPRAGTHRGNETQCEANGGAA